MARSPGRGTPEERMNWWIIAGSAIAGWLLGLGLFHEAGLGAVLGAAFGYFVLRQRQLEEQIRILELRITRLSTQRSTAATASERIRREVVATPVEPTPAETAPLETAPVETIPVETVLVAPPTPPLAAMAATTAGRTVRAPLPGFAPTGAGRPPPAAPAGPDFPERIRRWFTEGNVPVKVGMLVLFAGVGALLKYASDQGWLVLPIELRLAGIGLAATAALAFGFRERTERRTFALALQGGSIGILALTIFAAFRLYGLVPAGLAFALLVTLVAGTGVLAVLQDALSLAVLGVLAGFLAPILVSTGSGSHVALFSWYALLNAAILAVALAKPWRVLNLLGFACTFAVATAWGVLHYDAAHFRSTEPFLLLFFAFYLAIPVLYARRTGGPAAQGLVDGTLVFGNPLLCFGLQAALLEGELLPLAASALVVATTSVLLAWSLWRREGMRILAESHAVLAVGFATLTVPLALSGEATAGVFALEGAALIWLGLRQARRLPRYSGLALQLFAGIAFFAGNGGSHGTIPFLSGDFVAALLLVLGASIASWLYWRTQASTPVAVALYLWALGFWLVGGGSQIDRFVGDTESDACLVFASVTAALGAWGWRKLRASLPAWTAAASFVFATPILLLQSLAHGQPFDNWGLVAWIAFAILGAGALHALRDASRGTVAVAHLGWLHAWPLAFAFAGASVGDDLGLGASWSHLFFAAPLLAAWAVALLRPTWISPPLRTRFDEIRPALLSSQAALVALAFLGALPLEGGAAPLPWLPLANPLELAALAALALFAIWLAGEEAPGALAERRHPLLFTAGFALLTAATLRAVHHWADVRWDVDALFASSTTQMAIAVVWSAAGVIAWVVGSRRGSRPLWLTGAVLMGVVLAKLALIDRQHLGNLTGIVSFLAYGLLCTVVGYLAPAPPRTEGKLQS